MKIVIQKTFRALTPQCKSKHLAEYSVLPKRKYKSRTELRYTSANILPPVGMTLSLQHLLTFKNFFFKQKYNNIQYNNNAPKNYT